MIGDFTWTGWDYLGEAGIGRVDYADDRHGAGIRAALPVAAAPGAATSTSPATAAPASYYREVVYGLRPDPYIAVHRPSVTAADCGGRRGRGATPSRRGAGPHAEGGAGHGRRVRDADEVELFLDGASPAGARVGGEKALRRPYPRPSGDPASSSPWPLTGGVEVGRHTLSHGDRLGVARAASAEVPEIDADGLGFVQVSPEDESGTVFDPTRDQVVTVTVDGPGVLAGLGTGRARTEEQFAGPSCDHLRRAGALRRAAYRPRAQSR